MPDYGLDIAIPFTGDPDPTLPWADDDDALLVPGSLALFDATHSAAPLAAGMPAKDTDIPNIAWKRFRDLVGYANFSGRVDSGTAGTAGNVLTVTALAAGALAPGQSLSGTGLAGGGVYITVQLTGTPGGIGTYQTTAPTSTNTGSQTLAAAPIDATSGSLTRSGVADQPNIIVSERSSKGGIHVMVSQVNDTVNGNSIAISAKPTILNYVTANRSHSFYFSRWFRTTRSATAVSTIAPLTGGIGTGGTNYIMQLIQAAAAGFPAASVPTPLLALEDPIAPHLGYTGNNFRAYAGAGPGNGPVTAQLPVALNGWGLLGSYNNAGTYGNKSSSYIAYRSYIEDLTVSGRTAAQVAAIDYALYQATMGAGGRYSGDTFTQPLA